MVAPGMWVSISLWAACRRGGVIVDGDGLGVGAEGEGEVGGGGLADGGGDAGAGEVFEAGAR